MRKKLEEKLIKSIEKDIKNNKSLIEYSNKLPENEKLIEDIGDFKKIQLVERFRNWRCENC